MHFMEKERERENALGISITGSAGHTAATRVILCFPGGPSGPFVQWQGAFKDTAVLQATFQCSKHYVRRLRGISLLSHNTLLGIIK